MANKDAVYELIKTLTATEKRYFKVFASAFRTDSGLLRLFEVLDRAEAPSESEQKGAVGRTSLNAARSDLRKLILKAMRSFHDQSNLPSQHRNALTDIEFLQSKHLNDEAGKELGKVLKNTSTFEPFYELELLLKQNEIQSEFKNLDELEQTIAQRMNEAIRLSDEIRYYTQLVMLSKQWSIFLRQFDQGRSDLRASYFQKLESDVRQIFDAGQSPLIRSIASGLLANGLSIEGRNIESEQIANTAIEIYNSNNHLKKRRFDSYFSLVYNYASALYLRDEDEKSLRLIDDLIQAQQEVENSSIVDYPIYLRSRHKYALLSGRLRALCSMKRYRDAIPLIQEHADLIKQGVQTTNTQTELFILLRLASVEFHVVDVRMARKRLQALLKLKETKDLRHFFTLTLLAEAICSFELGDVLLFESQVENLFRRNVAKEEEGLLNDTMKDLLRSLARFDGSKQQARDLLDLCDRMEANQDHKEAKEFIDLVDWARKVVVRKP